MAPKKNKGGMLQLYFSDDEGRTFYDKDRPREAILVDYQERRDLKTISSEEEYRRVLHQQARRRLCQEDTECSQECKEEVFGDKRGRRCCEKNQITNGKCYLNADGNACSCTSDSRECYIEMRCQNFIDRYGNVGFRTFEEILERQLERLEQQTNYLGPWGFAEYDIGDTGVKMIGQGGPYDGKKFEQRDGILYYDGKKFSSPAWPVLSLEDIPTDSLTYQDGECRVKPDHQCRRGHNAYNGVDVSECTTGYRCSVFNPRLIVLQGDLDSWEEFSWEEFEKTGEKGNLIDLPTGVCVSV